MAKRIVYAGGESGVDYQNALNQFKNNPDIEVRRYDPNTTTLTKNDVLFGTPEAVNTNGATVYKGADRYASANLMTDYANANVPASTNVFTEDLLNKMMGNIDAAGQARLAQQRAARDTVIQGYQRDAEKAKPQYQLARDQANYQAKVGADATDERNARLGLFDSGRNISDQLKLETIRQANLKGITSEERNYLNDIDWKIKRLQEEGIAADDAILADLQTQKDQLMLSIYDRMQSQQNADRSYNYQVGRDAILDSRYADETAYNRGRDAISDERYNIE